jgi:prevent-host-death family protein
MAMPTVSLFDLRWELTKYLAEVEQHGTRFIVTRRGQPVCALVPLDDLEQLEEKPAEPKPPKRPRR